MSTVKSSKQNKTSEQALVAVAIKIEAHQTRLLLLLTQRPAPL